MIGRVVANTNARGRENQEEVFRDPSKMQTSTKRDLTNMYIRGMVCNGTSYVSKLVLATNKATKKWVAIWVKYTLLNTR